MKISVIDTNNILSKYIKEEVKKHPLCFVIWYPGEELLWESLSKSLGKDIQPKSSYDNQVVIISVKDMDKMKNIWDKMVKNGCSHAAEAYRKGKRFTW